MEFLKLFQTHSEYETFVSGDTMVRPNVSHCISENEVHYNPIPDPYNSHEYVDLGLPSGTKWAKMNVGANSPTDYGLYFAWGETQGYANASTKAFSWSDYKWTDDNGSSMSKYNATDGKTILDLEDDAAAINMGGDWHMPTTEQFQELLDTTYVTNTWVTDYNGSGVNGRLFTSVSNGNTMFVPAAAICQDGIVGNVGNYGDIWASTRDFRGVKSACYLDFTSSKTRVPDDGYRYSGQSIRGVVG